MKRIVFAVAALALALPSVALAKGPSSASIDGPGTGGGVNISGGGESPGTPLGDLTQQSGLFPALFGQQPDPMLDRRPKANLGPKYTVEYTVPGPNNETFSIRQDVYPYAKPSPVTYTPAGQKIFDMKSRGGWFVATSELKDTLVTAGLPKVAPSGSSSGSSGFSAGFVTLLMAALLLVGTTAILVRRRARPAAA